VVSHLREPVNYITFLFSCVSRNPIKTPTFEPINLCSSITTKLTSMKKIFLFSAIVFFSYAACFAQSSLLGKTPEKTAENKTKKLNNELSMSTNLPLPLSAKQLPEVKSIFLAYEEKAHPIRKKHESAADKSKMKAELKPLKAKLDSDLKQCLTADQYTRYENISFPKGEPAYFE